MSDMVDELDYDDEGAHLLYNLAYDLQVREAGLPFMKALFDCPYGQWIDVLAMSENIALDSLSRVIEADLEYELNPAVTWLPYPGTPEEASDYCILLFYNNSTAWSQVATFGKAYCLERLRLV